MKIKTLIIGIFLILTFLISSCEVINTQVDVNVDDNPQDVENPDYEPPLAIITEGADSIITDDFVTFKWTGNSDDCEFSYKLDNDNWSKWKSDSVVTYDYLDEITHLFQVKAKFLTDSVQNIPTTVPFTVNAIEGPALWLHNKKIETSVNDIFFVYIVAEEVIDLAMISLIVNFNPTYLSIQDYEISVNDSILEKSAVICVPKYDNDILDQLHFHLYDYLYCFHAESGEVLSTAFEKE